VATPIPSTVVEGGRSRVDGGAAGRHLIVMGPSAFRAVPLPARGELIVGRGRGADVDIDEPHASRRHARLRIDDGLTIEDLGSANGTRVRGRKLEPGKPVALAPGEAVAIGALVLMVQLDRLPSGASSVASASGVARSRRVPAGFAAGTGAVCEDEAMRGVYAMASRVARGTIGVLILGETGVGKEVLARAIHEASLRASAPFVSLNCAALSEALLESELFGHERGAFTGAAGAKPGLLETAPGGTVFLDEVGELTPSLQAKVLRVIETRELVRVGGVQARKIDVRFLAATNRDIEADVARGAFRRDLYYRLNGTTLVIPPLRERPRDLPLLARHLIEALARDAQRRRAPELSPEALAVLAAHAWPGNVRELRNVLERALLLSDGSLITEAHLPREVLRPRGAPAAVPAPAPAKSAASSERSRILEALAACAGNQSRAAKKLGISRKVMLARLDKYGVARPRKPVGE
jgi:transcriptional regulator with PAS, ATPase and Fis domain